MEDELLAGETRKVILEAIDDRAVKLLEAGLYNKLVKQLGSDRTENAA